MHAYIDQENYSKLTIDAALRELLKGFRLPGISQAYEMLNALQSEVTIELLWIEGSLQSHELH